MKIKLKNTYLSLSSFLLGFIFITAGISKFTDLPGIIGPVWLIEELAKHQLKLYGEFVAFSQIIIGFLLLTNRFRLVGTIMFIPMILNILMVTISLQWNGTPYVNAFLLAIGISMLVLDWTRLKLLLTENEKPLEPLKVERNNSRLDLAYIVLLLPILTGVFFYESSPLLAKNLCRYGFFSMLILLLGKNIYSFFSRRKSLKTANS